MNNTLKTSLVLCDLDHLLLGTDGNLPQVLRDVMQLFSSRGGRLTVFSQRSPKAVRTILGSVRLAAPALVCGGDRKSTRLNSSHRSLSRMPSSA